MRRSSPEDLVEPLKEPERFLHKKRKEVIQQEPKQMAEENPMWGSARAAPPQPAAAIVKPAITGDEFEIKGQFLHMIRELQFDGRRVHDPFNHVEAFLDICDLFKHKNTSSDAVRLRIFPFTLCGEAKEWSKNLAEGSVTTWALMREAFVKEFFPPAKADQLKREITEFTQRTGETMYEGWERYKRLLRACPTHGLNKEEQVKTFYGRLPAESKAALDAASGGIFMYKTATEAIKLLDDLAMHNRSWTIDLHPKMQPKAAVHMANHEEQSVIPILQNQVSTMNSTLLELTTLLKKNTLAENKPMMSEEEVAFMQQGYQGGNRYNNFHNRPYQTNAPPGFNYQQRAQQPERVGKTESSGVESLEAILQQFVKESSKITTELQQGYMKLEQNQRNQQASIQSLERNMGRIAESLADRPAGGLPSNTQKNPRETVNAVTTRSGKVVIPNHPVTPDQMVFEEKVEETIVDDEEEEEIVTEHPVTPDKMVDQEAEQGEKTKGDDVEKNDEKKEAAPISRGIYRPKVPFPQRLRKEKLKKKYEKFVEIIKQVRINVPLVELLAEIPNYGKFIKDMVSDQAKMESLAFMTMSEDTTSVIRKKAKKRSDTGSFTVPCYVDDRYYCEALADLGASISLMPLSVLRELRIEELTPTDMIIQLADRTTKRPEGIAENIPVRVGKFLFPVDFVILDMKEDDKVPIILGRPFLNTAEAVINVHQKEMSLGIGEDRVRFKVGRALKQNIASDDACFYMDVVDECVQEVSKPLP